MVPEVLVCAAAASTSPRSQQRLTGASFLRMNATAAVHILSAPFADAHHGRAPLRRTGSRAVTCPAGSAAQLAPLRGLAGPIRALLPPPSVLVLDTALHAASPAADSVLWTMFSTALSCCSHIICRHSHGARCHACTSHGRPTMHPSCDLLTYNEVPAGGAVAHAWCSCRSPAG